MNMVALIGGSGFIGSRLTRRLLEAGRRVRIIDIAPSRSYPELWVAGDVRDRRTLQPALRGCSVAVNLAAQHKDNVRPRSLYDEVNVEGARQVCRAMEEEGIGSLVFTSSVAVYGNAEAGADERSVPSPANDYGRTKLAAEGVYEGWRSASPARRTLVIVRPTVVFGERNRGNVYNLLKMIAGDRFVMVGRGDNVKSMAYVENVAAFLESTLEMKPGSHLFNYVDKPDFSMKQLVGFVRARLGKSTLGSLVVPYGLGMLGGRVFDLLASVTGRELPISSQRVRKFCATTRFESVRLAQTGFVPPVTIPEALERTLEFEFLRRPDPGAKPDTLFDSE